MTYPTSSAFRQAIGDGGTVVIDVQVVEEGKVIATPQLLVRDGSVTADAGATFWRRGDASLVNPGGDLIPTEAADLFSPVSGREFRPRRGVKLPSGVTEMVPLGTLKITGCNVDQDHVGTTIQLSGVDRGRFLSRNKWTDAHTLEGGYDYSVPPLDLFLNRAPEWMFLGPNADVQPPPEVGYPAPRLTWQPGSDPWNDIVDLANVVGYRTGFDVMGQWKFLPEPDPDDPNVNVAWNFITGRITSKVGTVYSDEDSYNGVVAVGQNSFGLTPPRAVVWDDNPASPTYYLGANGPNPFFMQPSEKIISYAQASAAARGKLNSLLGASQVVTLETVPNPALDLADYARLTFDQSKIDARYIIDRLVTPLRLDARQQVTTRERRIV